MTNLEMLQKWGESTVNGDWDTFEALTSDDFQLIGPGPEPLDKQAYRGWIKSVVEANTDHHNNMVVAPTSDSVFNGTVQMEGTHSKDWDLSFMGLGTIAATGKSWKNPQEKITLTISNGKVVKCEVEVPENGGIVGILSQLGVAVPK